MYRPRVSFIIVNYNGKKFLRHCLSSIFNLDYPVDKLEVILVDNGSCDGSIDFIKTRYPKVKFILNPINNYCFANNLAIRDTSTEYVALVNNDVILDRNWLNAVLTVMIEDNCIGAVTGKVLLYNKRINSAGHNQLDNFYWQDRGFWERDKGIYENIEEINGLSHCACFYRVSAILDVGYLDESFNMYLEDVDMSIRLKKNGWKIYYAPEAICYHYLHGSASKRKRQYFYERNRLFLVAKHYPSQLKEAIFDNSLFPTVERLNKKFLFSILKEIEYKFNHELHLDSLRQDIERFHKRYRKRIFFVRSIYNLLYYIQINRLISFKLKKFINRFYRNWKNKIIYTPELFPYPTG
ncbi:MAG: glycosyltransferase family 2 protein [Candidatus Omnitrophica bacterium]|nr:glycosyltransferase family 2 protein [Candidatus Omnitrophota bacterium]